MKKNGIIFDFNGTLFWDTNHQNAAWDQFMQRYNIALSPKEQKEYIHGRNAKDTFEYIFNKKVSDTELEILTEEKEILYRSICEKKEMVLAPGVVSLLNRLNKSDTKISIATAAGKSNVDFFIERFDLLKYFEVQRIIYNDGTIRGKPHPDLFNKAIVAMDVSRKDVIIFEDSISGIEAAIRANVRNIIIVDSNGENYESYDFMRITHFDQIDPEKIWQ